jgi:RNA polymerase sigma factor (sigma-70 family)
VRNELHRPTTLLERVFEEQGKRLWWSLLAFTGDREVAHDAVAEAFAQALRRGSQVRDPVAWVWKAGFRIAAGELKRRRSVASLEDKPYTPPEPIGLFEALDRLSSRQRAALVLHHYAGYSLEEISRILGTTKGTVGVHLSRGRRRLREFLEARDG